MPPSPDRIHELLQQGAARVLNAPAAALEDIDAAVHAAVGRSDPVNLAQIRKSNRLNLRHWASETLRDPGGPVPANLSPEMVRAAREQARFGVGDDLFSGYRAGESAAWLKWMDIVFELTDDPAELRAVLDLSARSIAGFVDRTARGLLAEMEQERQELARGSPAERLDLVRRILADQRIDMQDTGRRLGYALNRPHHAIILWSVAPDPDLRALEETADTLAGPEATALSVAADRGTVWMWLPRPTDRRLADTLAIGDTRIALGPRAEGLDGFRRSHDAARVTQRILSAGPPDRHVASHDEIRLVSLLVEDRAAQHRFVSEVLGDLASAGKELRTALRQYLRLGCNAARTAQRLQIHRNTLMRQIARAQDLLPGPLDDSRTEIAVALDVLHWMAPPASPRP
ncbi:PucR family transcriptional regulator [Lutimaribacter marinistellae]|uniref:PucR family transcriptional regulator n=1 Tax=Lutimaribacter marinistellae TaxID=1820329 RepID=A0ABV7TIV5_9RHOB